MINTAFILTNIYEIYPRYDEVRKFSKSMIAVRRNNKWGFVRAKTTWGVKLYEAIPPQYDAAEEFSGIIKVKTLVSLNGEQFFINREGKKVE